MVDHLNLRDLADTAFDRIAASLDPNNVGVTFMGGFTQYAPINIQHFGAEMGILMVLQFIFFIILMGKLNGHCTHMVRWVHFQDFEILGNIVKPGRWVGYLSMVGYSYMIMPFVTLFVWFFSLMKDASKHDKTLDYKNPTFMAAISVLLIGISMILFMLVMQKIRWNNYRFKQTHMIMLLLSVATFTAWQFCIAFASMYQQFSFQGISIVFLTQSGIIATIAIYINLYENKFSLSYFLHKFMKKGKKDDFLDPERTDDLIAEIEAQKADDDWLPTMNDVFDMITIGKISEQKMLNAFGAGFQSLTLARSRCCSNSLHLTLAFIYLGILGVYSYLVYDFDNGSKLGIVSSVAVMINDLYVILMYNARIINRISILTLIIFCSRLFILLGGSHYWIYGYLVIYVWLQSIIALGIVRKRLPFNNQIDNNENKSVKKTHFMDLARVPEFIFILITVSICVSIAVAESVSPQGVYLSPLLLGDVEVSYWVATMFAILIVVTVLFVSSWIRAFKRRIDQTVSQTYVYLCSRAIDQYYVICIINYGISIFWTLGMYNAYPNVSVLLVGLCTPAILFFLFNLIQIYIRNSYYFVVDTDGISRNIVAHNKRVDEIKEKGRAIRKLIIEDGPEAVYGEENGKLVKKVMDIEVARRQAAKLQAKIAAAEGSSDSEEGTKVKRSKTGKMAGRRNSVQNSPVKSPTKAPPAKSFGEEEKSPVADNTANPGNSMMMGSISKGAAFGGTMMGFKLDGDSSSEEDIDAIPAYLRAYYPQRIDKKRKAIVTWSEKGLSWTKAFFSGQMRENDLRFFWSFIFLGYLILIMGALGAVYSYKGIVIMFAFTMLHVVLLIISMLGYVLANRRMSTSERWTQFIAFLVQYISSIAYLVLAYDSSLLQKKNEDLDIDELYEKNACINYIASEMILAPLCTSFLAFIARAWRDSQNNRRMSKGFIILLALNTFHLVSLVIFMFIYLERAFALGLLAVVVFILYALVQYVLRFTYKEKAMKISEKISFPPHKLNKCMDWANKILGISVFVGISLILRYTENNYSAVAVQSIVVWLMITILFVAGMARFIGDRTRMDEMPIYHSPWVFPIYKYYPKLNDIEPYASGIIFFYALAAVSFIWAVYITVEVSPSWVGVAVTCAIEAMIVFFTLHIVNTNNAQYKKISPYVDQLVIKTAWCDAKENLVRMLHIDCRAEYDSYEKWWRRRHDLQNYMMLWQGKSLKSWPDTMEFDDAQQGINNATDKGEYLRARIEEWANSDEVNLDSWEDCQKFLHETDKDVRHAYLAELETIIQFQLIVLQNAKELQNEERKYLFKFIKEKRAELYMVGINFQVSNHENAEVRYAVAAAEIRKLSPDKLTLFNALRTKFQNDERQKAIDQQQAEDEALRKDAERQEMFSKMSGARAAAIEAMKANPDMPIDEMPDCPEKLTKIRKHATMEKFTDVQFDHINEEQVYGAHVHSQMGMRQITGWKRASEIPGAVLFRDGASHEDITQGKLGDCYFLSALSVLGNARIVDLFACQDDGKIHDESNPYHWKKTGCFMIKFFKNGNFQEVIVDDWIPWQTIEAIQVDHPAFTSGGTDGLEMWPCIIEKAYAKLYGSYSNIEAGKVHLALADMVDNGFPEQFALSTMGKNISVYKNIMRKLYRIEALLGAGTPEGSDKTSSGEGIVQGHAYAMLQVQDYKDEQLVQLRNPHGKADYSKEWTGEWADDSDRWNARAIETLNYTPNTEAVDGVFWMSQTDFLQQFKYVYVCRELSKKAGWYQIELSGEWIGQSAAGFPGKLPNVPQFKLTVNTPTPGYLALTQTEDSGSSFQGNNLTGWMVSREQGKLMRKIDKRRMLAKAGISNLKMLSAEVDFEEEGEYTIVCGAAQKRGYTGIGKFTVKVYTRDPNAKLEYLNYTAGY